jgi:short-subunit dehydrogenase
MGIGLEIAKAVAAKGANLTLFSRTEVCMASPGVL